MDWVRCTFGERQRTYVLTPVRRGLRILTDLCGEVALECDKQDSIR